MQAELPSDPKARKKYAQLVEMALKIEDDEPEPALELYKYVSRYFIPFTHNIIILCTLQSPAVY
jgi:hypothetical protein